MKERPILFSAPMVRAILDGRKTQTRRIVKPQPSEPAAKPLRHPAKHAGPYFDAYCGERKTEENPRGMSDRWCWWTADDRPDPLSEIRCPYGEPGDRLWVRETWRCFGGREYEYQQDPGAIVFRATDFGQAGDGDGWRPSIFMPRWASRIDLEVTGVRAEWLNAITEDDARAEGVPSLMGESRFAFEELWREINGRESWAANPWVWVVEFKRIEAQERAA